MVTIPIDLPDARFWSGRRVLLTGHSGFKGGWLTLWLHRLGARVTGISLPPSTEPNLFMLARIADVCDSHFCDIRDAAALAELVRAAQPEIVFHLAAQPLVRAGYADPVATYATNVMGTVHLLDALRQTDGVRVAVMVTTDKVYRNHEWPWPYREDDALGGQDPYSASKAASEIAITSYRAAYLVTRDTAVSSARAGNVIGGGDWSADRLLPDAVRAWQAGRTLYIRHPDAVRPWQHVLESLAGYLALAQATFDVPDLAGAYNFGPATAEEYSVRQVIVQAREAFGRGEVRWADRTEGPHEAGRLTLETAKVRTTLGVRPRWDLVQSVVATADWYRRQVEGYDVRALCEAQIEAFEAVCP